MKTAWLLLSVAAWTTLLGVVGGEVAYRWDKGGILGQEGPEKWRATSFALTKDKIFLTLVDVEKQTSGNGVVGAFNKSSSMSPTVSIFPYRNFYKINDPDRGRVTTPMSVRTDVCDRLWLLDSAVQNLSGIQIKTSPGIYVFNTKNNQLMRSFTIPSTQWTSTSFFVNFVVETEDVAHDCEETFAYFADFNRFHLLTYDFLRNKSELKSHPFFSPDPLVHTPQEIIFNKKHQDLNGIYGLAVASNDLYFHPLAATHEFKVSTHVLRSEGNINYKDVQVYKNKGDDSESGVSVFDPVTRTIFFSEVNTKKIGGIRVDKSGAPETSTYYRYDFNLKSGFIVDLVVYGSELWVLVDDPSHISIHKMPIADVTEGAHEMPQTTTPKVPSSASHKITDLGFLYLTAFAVLKCLWWF